MAEQDQKVPATDAPGVSPATSVDAGSESSEAGDNTPDSQFDMDAFRADLANATREEVSRGEFESVKRQAGQTKAMQREIAELRRELAERPTDVVSRKEYDLLLETLADAVPADRLSVLRGRQAEREATSVVKTELTALEKRILDRIGVKDGDDPDAGDALAPETVQAAIQRQWQLASEQVFAFAERLGVEVTPEDFRAAQTAAPRPDLAVEHLVKVLQTRAAGGAPTRTDRVEERKAAASGGATNAGPRDGSQGNYDLSTLGGLAKARKAGAITSEKFFEEYQRLNRDAGR